MALDPQAQAAYDQHMAHLGDTVVGMWRRLYTGCLDVGFTEAQAILLVQTHIAAASITVLQLPPAPVVPPKGDSK